ncbi:MAG: type II toxin-antitoxin system RelE/ParE family toxin [Stellaceae bacterium]
MGARGWKARLSGAAERDFLSILEWTSDGPDLPGARRRIDIAPGVWSLHIARGGRRGRHLLLYRVAGEGTIEIIRILHDSMDPARHLPEQQRDR